MEIRNLKNAELNEKIKTLTCQERKLTQEILEHVAEVDRRKLYLALSYPSLFDYLTKEIGYSAGAAQRRIDGARLFQKIPEVSVKIEQGSINLSQISKMQRICREIKRQSGEVVAVTKQKEILRVLENQNAQSTDLILAQELGVEVKVQERKQIQKDESVRVELTFSREEMELIQKAKELLSHKTGGSLKSALLEMAGQVVKSHKTKTSTATVAVKSLTPKLKNEILNRDVCCQFKDPAGRICGSRNFLEIDHIKPKFAGGTNSTENLRVLCSAHNKFRYKIGAGLRV